MRWTWLAAWAVAGLVIGCAGEDPFEKARREANPEAFGVAGDLEQTAAPPAAAAEQPEAEEPAGEPAGSETKPSRPSRPPAGPASQPAGTVGTPPTAAEPAQPVQRQVADVGVSRRTRRVAGTVMMPVQVYFRTGDAVVFRMQIPKAMQLFKAEHGFAPRSHEEFMEKIIRANMIQLPPLQPGERYVYDPKTEQLYVERPAK